MGEVEALNNQEPPSKRYRAQEVNEEDSLRAVQEFISARTCRNKSSIRVKVARGILLDAMEARSIYFLYKDETVHVRENLYSRLVQTSKGNGSSETTTSAPQGRVPYVDQMDQIKRVFEEDRSCLDDENFSLNLKEVRQTKNLYQAFRSKFQKPYFVKWCSEYGHSSHSKETLEDSQKKKLVAHIFKNKEKSTVIGKFVIKDPVAKFIFPRQVTRPNDVTHNSNSITVNQLKDNYKLPQLYVPLSQVSVGIISNVFGVVTAVNKLPVREVNKALWHSLFCISDPSLQPDETAAPAEFKIHTFFHFQSDFPELHRGDVVRLQNVKIESHLDRKDGRIFKQDQLTVFCHFDLEKIPNEKREAHQETIRCLSKWWQLNEKYFNYLTPHPCFNAGYRFNGIRTLQEISDGLIITLYCQVIVPFVSGDLFGLAVRDGTIFTLQKNQTSTSQWRNTKTSMDNTELENPRIENVMENYHKRKNYFLKKPFGYIALILFSQNQKNELQYLEINNEDYVVLHQVTVKFLDDNLLHEAGNNYPFQSPCVLLTLPQRKVHESLYKLERTHHEAFKIERRLRKLPDALEIMEQWDLPRTEPLPVDDDDVLLRISNREAQFNLMQNIRLCK